ncbi:MAG: Na/Pi cotransporter family protein [Mesorhizobium sp.]|nr:MAG: Na/Pi cotransporter family protein [Mesorhizobium sp.]
MPLLIAIGVIMFNFSEAKPLKAIARAVLGLGLMLLSLHLLGQATEPMRHSQVLQALMASLDAVPVLAVIVAAVLAIASSSSLAVVLLAMSLAASGTVGPGLGIALVLGANIGGAIPPVIATLGQDHSLAVSQSAISLFASSAAVLRCPLPNRRLPPF